MVAVAALSIRVSPDRTSARLAAFADEQIAGQEPIPVQLVGSQTKLLDVIELELHPLHVRVAEV